MNNTDRCFKFQKTTVNCNTVIIKKSLCKIENPEVCMYQGSASHVGLSLEAATLGRGRVRLIFFARLCERKYSRTFIAETQLRRKELRFL